MTMTAGIKIIDGPGELDFMTVLLRGGEIEVTVACSDRNKRVKLAIARRDSWNLSGDKIEVLPGTWVDIENARYSPRFRKGLIILPLTEEHPTCGHEVLKGTRFCPECGRDRMDVG